MKKTTQINHFLHDRLIAYRKVMHVFFTLLLISSSTLLISKTNTMRASFAFKGDTILLPSPNGENLLFYLQRNPNANTVIYELNYTKEGSLNPENPVIGSWIRYSEQGQHKELNSIEKKFAYGVQSKFLGKDEYEIRLAAYKKLPMYLKKAASDKKYHMYVHINNKQLLLKRVFVGVKGGSLWFPKVQYIDLFGTDASSGKELIHRIKI